MSGLYFCAFLYLSAYDLQGRLISARPLEDNALNWIQNEGEKATTELSTAKQHLVDTIQKLLDDGKIEIDSSVDKALQDISTFENDVPVDCHEKATKSLSRLRQSKKDYFLSCSKSSESVQNVERLSAKSLNIEAGFFSMTKDGAERISECSREGVLGAYQCGTTAIWDIIKNIMSGYSDMKRFIVSFTAHGARASRDIHDCLHPQGIDIQDHVDGIMADYHKCVHLSRRAKNRAGL
ncbi:Hypothetical protein NTJ_11993 [Nesidiocoris tenuis]|uniref:Uncharacterized protein n=1 Tax=Nesidiocoris tenuis TaxID=355587 RepID=A0ABN7B426_9HEMI|nr:Hypothetical protein NTJ_11993 [Nesidiocoris tenuis]